MKRLLITTLIIGVAVAFGVGALHASKTTAGLEAVAAQLVSDYAGATRIVSQKWQYIFVLLIALGASWLSLSKVPRWRSRLLIGLFLVELFALSWVCSLYRIFFQPIPSVLALVFAFAIAEGWSAFLRRDRSHLVRTFFADRLSNKEFRGLSDGTTPFDVEPKAYDVSIVVCDIGNKFAAGRIRSGGLAFAEDSQPVAFAEATSKFIREAAAHLTKEGAFLHAADGEGVVGVFGFPIPNNEHAQKAVRVVLDMMKNFREGRERNEEISRTWNVRAGISSGVIIAGGLKDSERPLLLASGEPIELARRFCALNNLYGSNALMDTPTFDQASESVVARPIDFVSGLNSHDRLEIYEPLWLAAEATPQHIARRDSFWSALVLYREKRWAEAYNEFQKARGSEEEEDPPLQFYLRKLEPLVLQLTESPFESI
jgi:class 3 adenylate cyclase